MALLKTKEVAQMLRVSEQTVHTLIKTNQIRSIKVGDRQRVDSADLQEFIRNNYSDSGNKPESPNAASAV